METESEKALLAALENLRRATEELRCLIREVSICGCDDQVAAVDPGHHT